MSSLLHAPPTRMTLAALAALAALALGCCAGSAQAVVVIEAFGSGHVSVDNASTKLMMDVTEQTLGGGRSVSGVRDIVIASATDVFGGAAVSGSAFAAPGVLKAKVDALAFVRSAAPGVSVSKAYAPVAVGSFGGSFSDTVLLSSATLAAGTPVQFVYTVELHATSNGAGHAGPQFGGYDSGAFYFDAYLGSSGGANLGLMYHYPNGAYQKVPNASFSYPRTVNGVIGDVVSLGATLSLGADDRAGWYGDGTGNLTFYGDLQETHLDASNTARFYLDAVTPGLDLVAESGHNYATAAVPEPGTWLLLALGLAVVGASRWPTRGFASTPRCSS